MDVECCLNFAVSECHHHFCLNVFYVFTLRVEQLKLT